jgi:conjugal transfer pilus assembly protein TraA
VNAAITSNFSPSRRTVQIICLALAVMVALMVCAKAGTTGLEFKETYDLIIGWAKGYLGKTFAIAAFMIGSGVAAARQTAMPAIFGLVLALILAFGPGLIEKILTATI